MSGTYTFFAFSCDSPPSSPHSVHFSSPLHKISRKSQLHPFSLLSPPILLSPLEAGFVHPFTTLLSSKPAIVKGNGGVYVSILPTLAASSTMADFALLFGSLSWLLSCHTILAWIFPCCPWICPVSLLCRLFHLHQLSTLVSPGPKPGSSLSTIHISSWAISAYVYKHYLQLLVPASPSPAQLSP